MRTYAPAATETVLDRLLEEPSLAAAVKHHARLPERDAITAPFPPWLDPRIVRGLEDRGITSLYSHQAEAVEAVHAGEDVVVVTPTASGKTLCYALPVLQALAEDSVGAGAVPVPDEGARPGPGGGVRRPRPRELARRSRRRRTTGTRPRPSDRRSARPGRSW